MTKLSHIDEQGAARMVDVSAKAHSVRRAVAEGRIALSPSALIAVRDGSGPKGDVLATARIAGIMAAKRTSDLIPLCHPLPLSAATIDFAFAGDAVEVTADVRTSAQTGVEMEALTAVSVALLTIYDMAKAVDKGAVIGGIRLLSKEGGKSGVWRAP
ncbi:MAG: cyclic pyranopterin monophosphate synthase MoaC [Pseudomonadota bacterium]